MAKKQDQAWDPTQNIGIGTERQGNKVILPETSQSSKIEVDPQLLAEARALEMAPKIETELPGNLATRLDAAERSLNQMHAARAPFATFDSYVAKIQADERSKGMILPHDPTKDMHTRWREALAGYDATIGQFHRWTNVVRRAKSVWERAAREAEPGKILQQAEALLDESAAQAARELAMRHQNLLQLWETANRLNQAPVWDTYNTKLREFQEDSDSLAAIKEAKQLLQEEVRIITRRG